MNIGDIFLLIVRWVHGISAATWIGGSLFFMLVYKPILSKHNQITKILNSDTSNSLRILIDTSIFVLLATGIILTFDRLNSNFIQLPYIYVLSIKIVLCLWIFLIARWSRKSKNSTTILEDNQSNKLNKFISSYNMVIILGLIVFLISDLLKIIVETTLLNNQFN